MTCDHPRAGEFGVTAARRWLKEVDDAIARVSKWGDDRAVREKLAELRTEREARLAHLERCVAKMERATEWSPLARVG